MSLQIIYYKNSNMSNTMSATLQEVASRMGYVSVTTINIDENPSASRTHNITSVPTLIILKDGMIVHRHEGSFSKAFLSEMLQPFNGNKQIIKG